MTFKAYIKKEYIESKREHRLIILFMGFIFFAIMTPPLLKLTPKILEKQYGEGFSEILKMTALESVSNYIGSTMTQICVLIFCITLSGVLCNEIRKGEIVFPITKGANKIAIVMAKFIFYSIVTFVISTIAVVSNIYYSFIVFNEEMPKLESVIMCSMNVYLYLLFILSLIFLFSSVLKKSMGTMIITMGINIILSLLSTFNYEWNPYNLIVKGSTLSIDIQGQAIIVDILVIIISMSLAIFIFNNKEIES